MFTPTKHWLNQLQEKKPSIEIFEEWTEIKEASGTTIKGSHLHVYKNNVTGLLDWSVEE